MKSYVRLGDYNNGIYVNNIISIAENIKVIYGLSFEEAGTYVLKFFTEEEYTKFSEAALLIKHYFRNSFL
jgi:hypothetical protein